MNGGIFGIDLPKGGHGKRILLLLLLLLLLLSERKADLAWECVEEQVSLPLAP